MRKLNLYLLFSGLFLATSSFSNEIHVSKRGNDRNNGTLMKPFKTISAAAEIAYPGDTVTVHSGTYREWVNPLRGGESDIKRIVYRAAPGERVEIKGSELVTGWKKEKNGIWKVSIPNSFFGNYNPYQDSIHGDWFLNKGRLHHTGEVFLNGKALYEKESINKVIKPIADTTLKDIIGSTYTWYCESNAENTTIWANFHKADPNKELTEISTRRTCFYPDKPGINYITISGFYFSQAATQWAAPTAEQTGMVATHWNKGWIIENNVISDSKCNGITLGKERSTGHNVWSADKENVNRDGNIHYIEVLFNVIRNNWSKETIGSHIVRNNRIFNCGQAGICGSMGAVFSTIENNEIFNIGQQQFEGWEIGGIKFHAPVDVVIKKNHIHDAIRGIWLDWMTQGTRVSGNLLYRNSSEDLCVEVNHGPYLIDNNIFLSNIAIINWSEGGAYIHNLIKGEVDIHNDATRFTPYFKPHSTEIAGLTTFIGGDDRFYNNIFIGEGNKSEKKFGLAVYNSAVLPVWIKGNAYYNYAQPSDKDEMMSIFTDEVPLFDLVEKGDNKYLNIKMNDFYLNHKVNIISTETLGKAKISKAAFEDTEGNVIKFNLDYFGNKRTEENNTAGPFTDLKSGKLLLKVW